MENEKWKIAPRSYEKQKIENRKQKVENGK
jgi:hypothetical protein